MTLPVIMFGRRIDPGAGLLVSDARQRGSGRHGAPRRPSTQPHAERSSSNGQRAVEGHQRQLAALRQFKTGRIVDRQMARLGQARGVVPGDGRAVDDQAGHGKNLGPALIDVGLPLGPVELSKAEPSGTLAPPPKRRERSLPIVADGHRHEARNRPATAGDGDLLAALDPFEKLAEVRLGLKRADGDDGGPPIWLTYSLLARWPSDSA